MAKLSASRYSHCVRLLLSLIALLALTVACGGKKEADITVDQLDTLVRGVEDTSFRNLAFDSEGSGEIDNAKLVHFNDVEPEHRAYIERLVKESRRTTGYARAYNTEFPVRSPLACSTLPRRWTSIRTKREPRRFSAGSTPSRPTRDRLAIGVTSSFQTSRLRFSLWVRRAPDA